MLSKVCITFLRKLFLLLTLMAAFIPTGCKKRLDPSKSTQQSTRKGKANSRFTAQATLYKPTMDSRLTRTLAQYKADGTLNLATQNPARNEDPTQLSPSEIAAIAGLQAGSLAKKHEAAQIVVHVKLKPAAGTINAPKRALSIQIYPSYQLLDPDERTRPEKPGAKLGLLGGEASAAGPQPSLEGVPKLEGILGGDYVVELRTLDGATKSFEVKSFANESELVADLKAYVKATNHTVSIDPIWARHAEGAEEGLSARLTKSLAADFVVEREASGFRIKPAVVDEMSSGDVLIKTYASGVTDRYNQKTGVTERRFTSVNRVEIGVFSEDGLLEEGKVVEGNKVTFYQPEIALGDSYDSPTVLADIDGKLTPLRSLGEGSSKYTLAAKDVYETMFELMQKQIIEGFIDDEHLKKMDLDRLMTYLASPDADGSPRFEKIGPNIALLTNEALAQGLQVEPKIVDQAILAFITEEGVVEKLMPHASPNLTRRKIMDAAVGRGDPEAIKFYIEKFGNDLSEFEKIRQQVIFGEPRPLSLEEFKQRTKDFAPQDLDALHNAAYAFDHAEIYEKGVTSVDPRQYAINFMWINRTPLGANATNLLGGSDADLKTKVTDKLAKWANKQPKDALINFWYDSELVAKNVVLATKEKVQASLGDRVAFRDIRDIPLVNDHKFAFVSAVPVYFRVDLLKAVIADHIMTADQIKYAVTADLDVEPVTQEHLFDARTVTFLDQAGHVFGRQGLDGFENSFIILNRDANGLMATHRATSILGPIESLKAGALLGSQSVYDTYPAFQRKMIDLYAAREKLEPSKLPFLSTDGPYRGFRKMMVYPPSQFNLGYGEKTQFQYDQRAIDVDIEARIKIQ